MQRSVTELFFQVVNGDSPMPFRTYESQVIFAKTKKVWSKQGVFCISPSSPPGSDVSTIGLYHISWMPLYIWKSRGSFILTTSYLIRNELLEYKCVVICSIIAIKVFYQCWVTIDNRDPMTIIYLEMVHIIVGLGHSALIDLFILRLGNGDVTYWLTNLEDESNTAMRVTICDSGSSFHFMIIKWSSMVPEIFREHQRHNRSGVHGGHQISPTGKMNKRKHTTSALISLM